MTTKADQSGASSSDTSGEGTGAVISALLANLVVAIAKFIAFMITGSSAILAESIHSTADTGNQALLLLGSKRANTPADVAHPFGYGQELYFWSLIVAIVLFGLGGGLSIWEGITHLMGPHTGGNTGSVWWNYGVLAVAFVAEGTALTYTAVQWHKRYADRSFRESLMEAKDPRLFIPLGEDIAALAGVIVAFLGVFLSHRLDMPAIDAAASIVIGVILAIVAFFLAFRTRRLLIGERTDPELIAQIAAAAEKEPTVAGIVHAMTMQLSPSEILLNLGVVFTDDADNHQDLLGALRRIEQRIRACDERITRIFIEPEPVDEHGLQPPL